MRWKSRKNGTPIYSANKNHSHRISINGIEEYERAYTQFFLHAYAVFICIRWEQKIYESQNFGTRPFFRFSFFLVSSEFGTITQIHFDLIEFKHVIYSFIFFLFSPCWFCCCKSKMIKNVITLKCRPLKTVIFSQIEIKKKW